jgi:hypothetical protein
MITIYQYNIILNIFLKMSLNYKILYELIIFNY